MTAASRKRLAESLELVIYNTRHVQHHAGQLNMLLRQRTDSTPGWASLPKQDLEG